MSYERILEGVPAKWANTKLNDGEFLGGILNFEVPNIVPIELERLAPRRARNSGHFQINGNKIGRFDMVCEVD